MNRGPGLESLPVELFYIVQLYALSDTLPLVCRHIYRVFKSAPPSFRAEYILSRVLADRMGDDILTYALRYPLCTMEVLDPLCHYIGGTCSFSELPQRPFRDLPVRGSGWTEDDPLPFIKYLYNHPSIEAPDAGFEYYALRKVGQACFLPLIDFLLEHQIWGDLTPLSWAAREGFAAVVRVLLARDDVDVNLKNVAGRTPLFSAAVHGREEVVKLLLAQDNTKINFWDGLGRTPLSSAIYQGCEGVAALLLARHDIDVNLKDRDSSTPLSLTADCGCEGVVKLLLARDDIDVNTKNLHGNTPLSLAADSGHEEVVKLLLARDDIDVNLRDWHGGTPLYMAAARGHEGVVKLLLARDEIDVNAEVFGDTPLSLASSHGYAGVVKLFLARDGVAGAIHWRAKVGLLG